MQVRFLGLSVDMLSQNRRSGPAQNLVKKRQMVSKLYVSAGKALSADYLFLSQDPLCGRREPIPTNCLLIPTEERVILAFECSLDLENLLYQESREPVTSARKQQKLWNLPQHSLLKMSSAKSPLCYGCFTPHLTKFLPFPLLWK